LGVDSTAGEALVDWDAENCDLARPTFGGRVYMSECLFPHRLTRRDFLLATWAAGLAAGPTSINVRAADAKVAPVKIGSGKYTYTLDERWGKLPTGLQFGYGCAVIADARDRVFVLTRSTNPTVAVFDKDGILLETWGTEFATRIGLQKPEQVLLTAYGLYWSKEGENEYLYWTENGDGPKRGPRIGARVYKTDLNAKVLYTIGNVANESSTSQKFAFDSPTDVAVAPNGDIYVVDGYGSQLLHRFDKNFKLIKSVGGPGRGHGQFNTCHGVRVRTLGKEPELYVADRGNHRVEIYSLDLKYRRTIDGLRLPCCFAEHDSMLYVPEMAGRVTILDADDKIVARVGNPGEFKVDDIAQHPDKFVAPHAVTLTSNGDLYVIEWLPFARPRKFRHTPAKKL
jgi:DNA-binding beta-propeller fold protein YncE